MNIIQDDAIERWKNKGFYIYVNSSIPLEVFVLQIGNALAEPEKTLLLLHGFPESSFSFHKVIDGLSAYFDRLILFDFPGYGFSDKPKKGYHYTLLHQADIALEVWRLLGIRGGHLLAHDMGDSVATELIARRIEKTLPKWFDIGFKSLTLTNGSIVMQFAQLRIMQKLLLTKLGKSLSFLSNRWIFGHQIKSAHGDVPLDEKEIDRLWAMQLHNNGKKIVHRTIHYILDRKQFEASRWLPALSLTQTPIHICWGKKDAVAKVQTAHFLQQNICPKASLTILENVGHFGQLGSPTAWLKAILAYYTADIK